MSQRLHRRDIGSAERNSRINPEQFGRDTAMQLIVAMRQRERPFIDDITTAEDVAKIHEYIYGGQQRASKNFTNLPPEGSGITLSDHRKQNAVLRGGTKTAIVSRLQELTLFHAAIAAERKHNIAHGVQPFISKDAEKGPDTDAVVSLGDALEDLAHGINKADNLEIKGFNGDLAASVNALGSYVVKNPRLLEVIPYVPELAVVDQGKKQRFWSGQFRNLVEEFGYLGNPVNILNPLSDPALSLEQLGLGDYFSPELVEEASRNSKISQGVGNLAISNG